MPRGHSDGVRVPTARPFFFFRRFYKFHYGEGEEIRRVVTKRQHRLVWMFDSSTARPFSLFCANLATCIMERMGEIQYQFIGKRAERNLCSIEKLHVLAKRKWIDAGGNPAVRHEGVPPSNNLIKDGTHRATVFVGPTLKSFSFYFRKIYHDLYGGD